MAHATAALAILGNPLLRARINYKALRSSTPWLKRPPIRVYSRSCQTDHPAGWATFEAGASAPDFRNGGGSKKRSCSQATIPTEALQPGSIHSAVGI